LSRYFVIFGVVVLIGLGLVGGGIFLLVQRETGTHARATVINCTSTASRYGGANCIGTWVVGDSVADGGRVVTGPIDGATRDDLGNTIEVTVSGDHAYIRSLTTSIVLLSIGLGIVVFMGVIIPLSLRRSTARPRADSEATGEAAAAVPVDEVAHQVRELRRAGRLADAVALIEGLGPYGVNDDDDWDTTLGASVLAAYAEQLAGSDPAGAQAAYRRAAELQRAFAAGATAGGEGLARMAVADLFEAKAR
jgi:hypothetical protein